MSVDVTTPSFSGPFDLLLHLILRDEVDLYEIRLVDIVDAYLAELDRLEAMDLELATEFLMIAATLVELKSRRLLPDDADVDLDDELALWEERDLLLSRLVECKTFKDAARSLSAIADDAARCFARTAGPEERFVGLLPDLLANTTPADLRTAFLRATAPKPTPRVDVGHLHLVKVSVTDTMATLLRDLPHAGRVSFAELTDGLVERLEVVVHFLAVLELFKQGFIDLDDGTTVGRLDVIWLGADGEADDVETLDVDAVLDLVDVYDG